MDEGATGELGAPDALREQGMGQWPVPHAELVRRLLPALESREEVRAVLLGGSLVSGVSDSYSDIDFTVVCAADARDGLLEGERLPRELGCLSAFRGDHLREPRLLICLFASPLLHVDFKLVTPVESAERVEPRAVLFCKDDELSARHLDGEISELPCITFDWAEPRLWTWLHYGITKAARGEVFECLDLLAFLRGRVLGPMALLASGQSGLAAQGVRRFELRAPRYRAALAGCVATPDVASCLESLDAARRLYVELRVALGWEQDDSRLEGAVTEFLSAERDARAR